VKQLSGHQGSIYAIDYSPDGNMLLSVGADATARLWAVASGQELKRFAGSDAPLYTAAFSPNGALAAAAGLAKTVYVWDVGSGQLKLSLTGHTDHVYRVVFNPAGTRLLSAGYTGNVFVWDVASGKSLFTTKLPSAANFAVYSPDGARVLVSCADGNGYLIDLPPEAK
jgi:WD40 repeat protein